MVITCRATVQPDNEGKCLEYSNVNVAVFSIQRGELRGQSGCWIITALTFPYCMSLPLRLGIYITSPIHD
jgi:hypothetical protein